MQQIIYLVIGVLIGYLLFRIRKLSENKVVEKKLELPDTGQSLARPEKITNPYTDSRRLKAGSRDYFFDLRGTQRGDKYLHITESRLKDGAEIRGNIVVFQNHIEEFSDTLEEMKRKIKE